MIKVTGHRILVKVEKLEDVDDVYRNAKKSGIVFAETDESKRASAGLDQGTVVQVGADCWKAFTVSNGDDPSSVIPWCKDGDFIAFAKYSGKLIVDPETKEKFIVINDEDIVAVLTGAKQ